MEDGLYLRVEGAPGELAIVRSDDVEALVAEQEIWQWGGFSTRLYRVENGKEVAYG